LFLAKLDRHGLPVSCGFALFELWRGGVPRNSR
jgi:hypothetical protein